MSGTDPRGAASNWGMTDEEMQHIAELHFDGHRPRSGDREVYAALDLVVWELQLMSCADSPPPAMPDIETTPEK